MKNEKVIILIPAYMPSNELITLTKALLEKYFSRIVIVDDGSGKNFSDVFHALPLQITLLKHSVNRGKGGALKTGLTFIHENHRNSLGVITCDADGQHRPEDIYKVAAELVKQKDMPALILGSRAFDGDVPARSAFGNTVTRGVFFLASRIRLRDTQTGLRAFPCDMIPALLEIPGERYEYEINMLLELARQKITITEVEIETVYIDGNKSSHFHTIRDSAIIYGNIIKFSLSSLLCFGIDFAVLFLFQYLTAGLGAKISLLISVICARSISSGLNFCLNRHVVFKRNSSHAILKYYVLVLGILGMNYGLLYVCNLLLGIPLLPAKLMVEIVLFLVSYTIQKKWIFNRMHNRHYNSIGEKIPHEHICCRMGKEGTKL